MKTDVHQMTVGLASTSRSRGTQRKWIFEYGLALIFLLPSLAFLVLFVLLPLIQAIRLSFFDWNGLSPTMNFVGTANFIGLWTEPRFLLSLGRNMLWWIMHVGLAAGGGLVIATLIAEVKWGQVVFRTLAFFPYVLSLAVVGVIWGQLYNPVIGFVNNVLQAVGLGSLTRAWLGDPQLALPSVGVASAWQAYGFYMVIFLASIQGINPQLYEAAMVDGASGWQRFRYITIPSLHNTMTLVLTLAFINALKGFGTVWAMTQGGPGYSTEIVAVYVWRVAFQLGNIGRATAAGLTLGIIVIVLTVVFNQWRDKEA